jgi:glutamyl-Q tRNA(Asp) synthetase
VPLVLGADGHKLSKQNGARAIDLRDPLAALREAARVLQLPPIVAVSVADWLGAAVTAWSARWVA